MAIQRVQQLATGCVEDRDAAIHAAACEPLAVGAVRHAQHEPLLLKTLLTLLEDVKGILRSRVWFSSNLHTPAFDI